MEKTAIINKIINFSNVDGPGNRTAIFFQTCPFNCLYCHNPETINKCNNCGLCVEECPQKALSIIDNKVIWNENLCAFCDKCISVCKKNSSPKTKIVTVSDLIEIIKKNKAFIRGITVSGGECMNHSAFLLELFKEVKKLNLTTFIDSNGYYDFEKYKELLDVTDYVMLDVKAFDNSFHKKLTGKDNNIVLKNLEYLLSINKMYEVRTVLLNNQMENNINTIIETAKIINNRCIYKLIKYRQFGVRKENLDILGNYTFEDKNMDLCKEIALKYTNNVIVR